MEASHCSVGVAPGSKYFRTGVVERIFFVSSRAAPRTWSSQRNSLFGSISRWRSPSNFPSLLNTSACSLRIDSGISGVLL